jgi:hypothetical protein
MPDLRDEVARFFSPDRWRTPMAEFERSGYALADEVNALTPKFVIDAGCGYNLFKGKIPNLIGIDLVNPAADLVCDIEEAPISPASIDVILALGAVNYGDQPTIERQLTRLAYWLTPTGRLIMRANPGMATGPGLTFFRWSEDNIDSIGAAAGLRRDTPIHYDTYTNNKSEKEPRLVWHYRPASL